MSLELFLKVCRHTKHKNSVWDEGNWRVWQLYIYHRHASLWHVEPMPSNHGITNILEKHFVPNSNQSKHIAYLNFFNVVFINVILI